MRGYVLSELALGGIGLAPTAGGGVKVASPHRTKGLQWPRVYIVGLEQGTLPDYRTKIVPAITVKAPIVRRIDSISAMGDVMAAA